MRTPSYIAFVAAAALAISTVVSHVLTGIYGRSSSPETVSYEILSALLEGIVAGVLVWVGTYIGARWAAPHQRTVRLAQLLSVLYLIIGVAMTLPMKTHAVLLDMPPPSGSARPLDFIRPLVASVVGPLAVVIGPLFLARGVAALWGREVGSDA